MRRLRRSERCISIYLKVVRKGLSHSLVVRVGCEVTFRRVEVTGCDEGKCALETCENNDIDDVDADGADEQDEIENCHKKDDVC